MVPRPSCSFASSFFFSFLLVDLPLLYKEPLTIYSLPALLHNTKPKLHDLVREQHFTTITR